MKKAHRLSNRRSSSYRGRDTWWIFAAVAAIVWLLLARGETASQTASSDDSGTAQPTVSATRLQPPQARGRYDAYRQSLGLFPSGGAGAPGFDNVAGAAGWREERLDDVAGQAGIAASIAAQVDPVIAEGMAEELRASIAEEEEATVVVVNAAD